MSGNTFGTVFKVTTFGESHGAGLGCVIDGCPSGIAISIEEIQQALNRRRPGISIDGKLNPSVTARTEADKVEIISGIFNGRTEGTPICLLIRNTSQHSSDYDNLKNTMRPGHADYTYAEKYGAENRDYRGGGRASGRETAARVAAGAVAEALLREKGIKVLAYTIRAAGIDIPRRNFDEIEQNSLRAPDNGSAEGVLKKIEGARKGGDSVGGVIECIVDGCPAGLGEPVFDKLDAEIAKAVLSIGAVKGIEFGDGFACADYFGSYNNDQAHVLHAQGELENSSVHADASKGCSKVVFETNHAGGILGGISNGNRIIFRVPVKPVPSIFKKQETVKKSETDGSYENTELEIKGRHDVCLCPRIVPVIEAMTKIVLADMLMRL